jgi:hypothetical protein
MERFAAVALEVTVETEGEVGKALARWLEVERTCSFMPRLPGSATRPGSNSPLPGLLEGVATVLDHLDEML